MRLQRHAAVQQRQQRRQDQAARSARNRPGPAVAERHRLADQRPAVGGGRRGQRGERQHHLVRRRAAPRGARTARLRMGSRRPSTAPAAGSGHTCQPGVGRSSSASSVLTAGPLRTAAGRRSAPRWSSARRPRSCSAGSGPRRRPGCAATSAAGPGSGRPVGRRNGYAVSTCSRCHGCTGSRGGSPAPVAASVRRNGEHLQRHRRAVLGRVGQHLGRGHAQSGYGSTGAAGDRPPRLLQPGQARRPGPPARQRVIADGRSGWPARARARSATLLASWRARRLPLGGAQARTRSPGR